MRLDFIVNEYTVVMFSLLIIHSGVVIDKFENIQDGKTEMRYPGIENYLHSGEVSQKYEIMTPVNLG